MSQEAREIRPNDRESSKVPGGGRGAVLAVLCFAQLVLLLDFSIVNVALPQIQRGLGFSLSGIQWVVSAYALAFGGLLLLGGRLCDTVGRRRTLLIGLTLFGLASLAGGLVQAPGLLVTARVLQGMGAALASPAILALITTGFAEGPERNRALGWFSAATAGGFALGVLLGGVLTQLSGWRLVFFVNVPIIAIIIGFARWLIHESAPTGGPRRLDVPGALLSTAGCSAVIYGLSIVPSGGLAPMWWIMAGLLLLLAFVLVEARSANPLVSLGIFRLRAVSVANVTSLLLPGLMGAVALQLSLFLQQVQGRSALATGLAFLPFGAIIFIAGPIAAILSGKVGPKAVCAVGALLVAAGVLLLSRFTPGTPYLSMLPGLLVTGMGFAAFFATAAMFATGGIPDHQQGLAGALLSTSQQFGTALGIAVLMTIAHQNAGGADPATMAEGFQRAFRIGSYVAVVTAILVFVGLPRTQQNSEGI
ncbi:MFS transporter [Kitasatospora sp. HPMI-4]|uniref:MFS transporter n=1 Tax=Kitasatospora sp. HPMI-4 TaxID=3448443 RepID=UPI003F1B2C8E